MVLLQPKLNLRVSQKQILTPGLVQMVSVLALNKIELKDMITQEITENPVLEELESPVPLLDDVAQKEEDRERKGPEEGAVEGEKSDPFDEIDFGSYFKEYLDPGFRSPNDFEQSDKPSFENFLSIPSTLTDHLMWQLGAMTLKPEVRAAAELVVGNLNEDGYLTASEEELLGLVPPTKEPFTSEDGKKVSAKARNEDFAHDLPIRNPRLNPALLDSATLDPAPLYPTISNSGALNAAHDPLIFNPTVFDSATLDPTTLEAMDHDSEHFTDAGTLSSQHDSHSAGDRSPAELLAFSRRGAVTDAYSEKASDPGTEIAQKDTKKGVRLRPTTQASSGSAYSAQVIFDRQTLLEAIDVVRHMDPVGVASRNLPECLLTQLRHLQKSQSKVKTPAVSVAEDHAKEPEVDPQEQLIRDAILIVETQLKNLQNKQYRDIAKAIGRQVETVLSAIDVIRTLDPKPGARYNKTEAKLIEPDVAFVKNADDWVVMMNEDDIPVLRLNPGYKKLMHRDAAEKDVRNYVKERYKSAIQLMKNIEQRKHTILRTCYAIIGRQRDFLEHGIEHLKPMMIKDVAEEIGVHPSTVSRAVASKYVHTPQGVYELRYFFSESVQGPEGGGTSLMLLKRKVKKLIEEEDSKHPFTDDQLAKMLQSQGIEVTRRTVAKYREDMRIPSTHQRRVKD